MRNQLDLHRGAPCNRKSKASDMKLGDTVTFDVHDVIGRKIAELDCRLMVGDYLRPAELRRIPKVTKL
jgi:hypothetical protein